MCRSIGNKNAKVFPDPVFATPITSRPDIKAGIACRWIGKGFYTVSGYQGRKSRGEEIAREQPLRDWLVFVRYTLKLDAFAHVPVRFLKAEHTNAKKLSRHGQTKHRVYYELQLYHRPLNSKRNIECRDEKHGPRVSVVSRRIPIISYSDSFQ